MISEIKKQAADPNGPPPADIVENVYKPLPSHIKNDIGKKRSKKKLANRIRNKILGKRKQPKNLDEVILDDDVRFMTDADGNRVEMVAYDSGPRDRNRIIIFCPKENMEKLAKCEQALSDSTFVHPPGFKQVIIKMSYSINIFSHIVSC